MGPVMTGDAAGSGGQRDPGRGMPIACQPGRMRYRIRRWTAPVTPHRLVRCQGGKVPVAPYPVVLSARVPTPVRPDKPNRGKRPRPFAGIWRGNPQGKRWEDHLQQLQKNQRAGRDIILFPL